MKRFIFRRGKLKKIESDNASNFVAANNELQFIHAFTNSPKHREKISKVVCDPQIQLFKYHVERVVTDLLFTFEELNTFIIRVKAILNSRPLTAISSDPNDPPIFTSAHFLIGDSLTSLPETDWSDIPTNQLSRWQHISKVRQHFWNRWHEEYLNELNVRHEWTTGERPINLNSIVLLKEGNVPSMEWCMGKVIEVHPGADG